MKPTCGQITVLATISTRQTRKSQEQKCSENLLINNHSIRIVCVCQSAHLFSKVVAGAGDTDAAATAAAAVASCCRLLSTITWHLVCTVE